MKLVITILIFLFISTIACGQTIDSVVVGSGGGFSGRVTGYKISGRTIVKGTGLIPIRYAEVTRLRRGTAQAVNRSARSVLKISPFDQPSNTYKFIEIFSDKRKIRFVWGEPSFAPPQQVIDCYNQVFKIIGNSKFHQR